MEIKLKELEKILHLIVKKAHKNGIDTIKLEHDFYWNIDVEQKLNLKKDPKPDVGSLCDDLESLRKVLDKENDLSIIDFERLGNLLTYIGERILVSERIF